MYTKARPHALSAGNKTTCFYFPIGITVNFFIFEFLKFQLFITSIIVYIIKKTLNLFAL